MIVGPICDVRGWSKRATVLSAAASSGNRFTVGKIGPVTALSSAKRPPPRCRRAWLVLLLFVLLRLFFDVLFDISCFGSRIKRAFRPGCGASWRAHCVGGYAANADLVPRDVLCDLGNWRNRKTLRALSCNGHPRPRRNKRKRVLGIGHPPLFARIVVLATERTWRRGNGRTSRGQIGDRWQ
jgi:hypothetical protein